LTSLLTPPWQAPPSVGALMSTRLGGGSTAPWHGLNVSYSVGDDAATVAANRQRVFAHSGATPRWLHLVHGTAVHRWRHSDAATLSPKADAAWTDEPGLACVVTAADCLPVLLCTPDGRAVAAAHAGWRGLAAGVLENTVAALCQGSGCDSADLVVWLGPCIGPQRFEVGADVLLAFGADVHKPDPLRFKPTTGGDGTPRWLANLPLLARERLGRVGVRRISDSALCTASDASRFFSHRRDGLTGRMCAAVWRRA
jgi:polyphenol oxidase